jgi:hypothetical protein
VAGQVSSAPDRRSAELSDREAIGRQLGVSTAQVAAESFGPLGPIFASDQPSSSAWTRERFGWEPSHPNLLEDLEAGNYPVA